MEFEFLELAQLELDETVIYYENQQKNLGIKFAQEVKNCLDRIERFPEGWQKLTLNTRRALLQKFPYGVIYQIKTDLILIIAIANLRRKPNYWVDRI